jgi:heterodisulfide reductase subunit A-like polyferredoxin
MIQNETKKILTTTGVSLLGLGGIGKQITQSPEIVRTKRSNTIKTNILVVGGEPAGIGAAIGAAKAGARTLLIENYGFFGGVASWGIWMCLNQMRPDEKPRGFVHELLLQKLQNFGEQAYPPVFRECGIP